MVFLKYLTFKTGINPSVRSRFDMKNLSGTQKLQLSSSRIFGNMIMGNQSSGRKDLRRKLKGTRMLERYCLPVYDMNRVMPGLADIEKKKRLQMLEENRQLRILMRGIKIGKRQGGGKIKIMSVFEKQGENKEIDYDDLD